MNVGQLCQHPAIAVNPTDELRTAARLMREHHIGYLVVVAAEAGADARPVGVITDRDIVISTLALDVDPQSVSVGDVMTRNPAIALAEDSVADALCEMRHRGVRRLPVVDEHCALVGVLSLDDVLRQRADEMGVAAAVVAKEREQEDRVRG